jgi:predicted site-specific integrase-resolvase
MLDEIREIVRQEIVAAMGDRLPEIMTPAETGKYLGLSIKTLAIWRCKGEGPAYIKSGGVMYLVSDLKEYVEKRRVKT